jgi:hypothetical protein
MVLIRECDGEGKLIQPSDPTEKDRLRKECLKHATGPDRIINWDVYYSGLFGEELFSDLSSESDTNSGSDSDCVFLSATSGTVKKDECWEIRPFQDASRGSIGGNLSSRSIGMSSFAGEVLAEDSLYVDVSVMDSFRSKFDISATGQEEDVVLLLVILASVCATKRWLAKGMSLTSCIPPYWRSLA